MEEFRYLFLKFFYSTGLSAKPR